MDSFVETSATRAAVAGDPRPSFFEFDGQAWTPNRVSRSPWNRNATNGMAVAGLLMHLAEQVEAPVPMLPAHVTIDILRPVPFAPTLTRAEVTRDGKKMQMVESHLLAAGEVVARARVLRVREATSPSIAAPNPYPPPEDCADKAFFRDGHRMAQLVDTRQIADAKVGDPKGVVWSRFTSELAPGVPIDGVVQAAIIADYGNGLSRLTNPREWSFANMDISLHLVRRPVGEWMLVEAGGLLQGCGVGLSNMMLADREGQFGRAHQSLFITPTA